MNQRDYLTITIDNFMKSLGMRADIALLFLLIFFIALMLCISIAKKNKLFYFSNNDSTKNLNEQELIP